MGNLPTLQFVDHYLNLERSKISIQLWSINVHKLLLVLSNAGEVVCNINSECFFFLFFSLFWRLINFTCMSPTAKTSLTPVSSSRARPGGSSMWVGSLFFSLSSFWRFLWHGGKMLETTQRADRGHQRAAVTDPG